MNAVDRLLDKARGVCSRPSDAALAERIGVSRQVVSTWRKGTAPVPDERIAQLAALIHEDAAEWMVQIRAEQSTGPAAKAWAGLARKLASAAALVLLVGAAGAPSPAAASEGTKATAPSLYIMSIP